MKKIFLALIFVSSLFAISSDKYIVLDENAQFKDANNSVIEIFSYSCIHCYNHHKNGTLAKLATLFPKADFDIWQVKEMAQFGEDFVNIMGYANALDKRDGVSNTDEKSLLHQILNAYFEAFFKYNLPFKDQDAFYSVAIGIFNAAGHNVSKEELLNYTLSDSAKAYADKSAQSLKVAEILGTPAFVINGKYILRTENIKNEDEFKECIKELLQM